MTCPINNNADDKSQLSNLLHPTPTAEIMKVHIARWTRKNHFYLWFREHYFKVVNILRSRAYLRMKYIKQRQEATIKLLNSRGEQMTTEKLIKRNHEMSKSYCNYSKQFWVYVN
jgi:hypothetical protein